MPQAARAVPFGRPSDYTPQQAEAICNEIAQGEPLTRICKNGQNLTPAKVFRWLATFTEFREMYARACEQRVEVYASEIIELADEPVPPGDNAAVQRARLRVDTRKWLMSKLAPRKYGDRVEHVIKTNNAADLTDDELARIAMASAPALLLPPASPVLPDDGDGES